MTDDHGWISAHVHYEGDLDPLILDAVGPLVDELADRGWLGGYFFLRYWDGGPHLRVRIRPATPDRATDVTELITHRIGDHLRRHPSADRLTDDEYRRSASRLGTWERVAPQTDRIPNNTVRFVPYVRETSRYGTGAAVERVERHFDTSSRLALEVLRRRPTTAQRETLALSAILLTSLVLDGHGADDRPRRTAATWTELLTADGRATAVSLEEHYHRQRPRLRSLTAQMRAVVRHAGQLPRQAFFGRWLHAVDDLFASTEGASPHAATPEAPDPATVADLCTHLLCNRLGVRLEAEGSLRHLAGRALLDADGDNAGSPPAPATGLEPSCHRRQS